MNWVRLRPWVLMRRGNRRAASAENRDHKVPASLRTRACRDLGAPGLLYASLLPNPSFTARTTEAPGLHSYSLMFAENVSAILLVVWLLWTALRMTKITFYILQDPWCHHVSDREAVCKPGTDKVWLTALLLPRQSCSSMDLR